MSVPTTWAELKTELADWVNRDDLTSQIANFIGYAEARFNRRLRVPEMESDASSSVSTNNITLPTDFQSLRSVYVDSVPRVALSQLSPSRLVQLYPNNSLTSTPREFALQENTNLLLGPYPDAAYTIVINYYAKLSALGSGQATNWLLTSHPDLYLSAALAEAYLFMKDESRAGIWDSRTEAKIAELNEEGRRKARSDAPIKLRSDLPRICGAYDITRG